MPEQLSCNLVFAASVVILTTSFPFGYNGGLLNQPLEFVREFYNDTYTERRHDGTSLSHITVTVLLSITNTTFVIGSMIGKFIAGYLMDRVGRKNLILMGNVSLYCCL